MIIKIFIVIGGVTTCALILGLIGSICYWIKEVIQKIYLHYQYKHRFNKPPLATCYCLYCENHGKTGKCMLPGIERYTPNDGFCYMAYPKKEVNRERHDTN